MMQRKKFINFVLEEGKRARGIIAIGEIVLSENLYTSYNFSQNIHKVFSNFYGDIIEDSYKHLKKVYGACQTEFGYYNRGTELEVNNFMSQLDIVSNRYDKLKYYDATKI